MNITLLFAIRVERKKRVTETSKDAVIPSVQRSMHSPLDSRGEPHSFQPTSFHPQRSRPSSAPAPNITTIPGMSNTNVSQISLDSLHVRPSTASAVTEQISTAERSQPLPSTSAERDQLPPALVGMLDHIMGQVNKT